MVGKPGILMRDWNRGLWIGSDGSCGNTAEEREYVPQFQDALDIQPEDTVLTYLTECSRLRDKGLDF